MAVTEEVGSGWSAGKVRARVCLRACACVVCARAMLVFFTSRSRFDVSHVSAMTRFSSHVLASKRLEQMDVHRFLCAALKARSQSFSSRPDGTFAQNYARYTHVLADYLLNRQVQQETLWFREGWVQTCRGNGLACLLAPSPTAALGTWAPLGRVELGLIRASGFSSFSIFLIFLCDSPIAPSSPLRHQSGLPEQPLERRETGIAADVHGH